MRKLKTIQLVFNTGEHIEFKAKHVQCDFGLKSPYIESKSSNHFKEVRITKLVFSKKANRKFRSKMLLKSKQSPFERLMEIEDVFKIALVYKDGSFEELYPIWKEEKWDEDGLIPENGYQHTEYRMDTKELIIRILNPMDNIMNEKELSKINN